MKQKIKTVRDFHEYSIWKWKLKINSKVLIVNGEMQKEACVLNTINRYDKVE